MLGWLVLAAAITVMVKVAEIEGRSTVFWGVVTFGLCFLSMMYVPLPFINISLGLVASYLLMFVMKLVGRDWP